MIKHSEFALQLKAAANALNKRYDRLFVWARIHRMENAKTHREQKSLALEDLRANELGACTRCDLCRARSHIVFGEGNPNADLMLIGEAPGKDEDRQGRPFVGRAGQLLARLLEEAGFTREQVYIANVIKCRPPENRTPEPEEVSTCKPFLLQQVRIIDPKVLVLLGSVATKAFFGFEKTISRMRGQELAHEGRVTIPTYHPAFALRNPPSVETVRHDIFLACEFLKKELNA